MARQPLVVALITLGDPNTLTGGYLYHRRLAERAPQNDTRIEFLSYRPGSWAAAFAQIPSLLGKARRLGAGVIVTDSIAAAFLAPYFWLRESPLPLVAMLHQQPGGIDGRPPFTTLQASLDRSTYRHARMLLVASDSLAADLKREGFADRRIEVVLPGRDVAPNAVPAGDLRKGRHAAFLCVGNWMKRKGIHSLLEAFARLPQEAATLHLAGDDNADAAYAPRVRQRLSRADLAGRVVVHGPLAIERVAGLYSGADVFVLPSLKEPYGTVYGEAMAYGLPVVGWRAGNLPYLADDGREGLIVPVGDIAGLAKALRSLAYDAELRSRLGEASRKRALTRPTWDETAATFFRLVRDVAEGRSI